MAGVYREIWTGRLVETFRPEIEASFLGLIPSFDQYVQSSNNGENQVIHLVDIGVDPEVLLNNTTYPIGYQQIDDGDIAFQLDKYQTKATPVSDDELYAIAYDKIDSLNKRHKAAILATKFAKAVHALAPQEHTTDTPVLLSTGSDFAGRKRVTLEDIILLRQAFNNAGVPDDGNRVLVLSSDHLTDLLIEDKNLYKNYVNTKTGELQPLLYGFNVFTYFNMPNFTIGTKAKTSFGAVATSNESAASVAFYAPDMFRATGATKMYYDKPDTQNQRSAFNYRHYYLVAPMKQRAIGALISAKA